MALEFICRATGCPSFGEVPGDPGGLLWTFGARADVSITLTREQLREIVAPGQTALLLTRPPTAEPDPER